MQNAIARTASHLQTPVAGIAQVACRRPGYPYLAPLPLEVLDGDTEILGHVPAVVRPHRVVLVHKGRVVPGGRDGVREYGERVVAARQQDHSELPDGLGGGGGKWRRFPLVSGFALYFSF